MIDRGKLAPWTLLVPEQGSQEAILSALTPLLKVRESQLGAVGVVPVPPRLGAEEAAAWAQATLPPPTPDDGPWAQRPYALIVGDVEQVPWAVQLQLQQRASTGRLPWTDPQVLAAYAQRLLALESAPPTGQDDGAGQGDLVVFNAVGKALDADGNTKQRAKVLVSAVVDRLRPLQDRGEIPLYQIVDDLIREDDPAADLAERAQRARATLLLTHGRATEAPGEGWPEPALQDELQGALVLAPWGLPDETAEDPPDLRLLRSLVLLNPPTLARLPALPNGVWIAAHRDSAGALPDSPIVDAIGEVKRLVRSERGRVYRPSAVRPTAASPRGEGWLNPLPGAGLVRDPGPVAVLAHLDELFYESFGSNLGELQPQLVGAVAEALFRGEPVGRAHDVLVRRAQRIAQGLDAERRQSQSTAAWRSLAAADLGLWVLFGDPAATMLHRSMARPIPPPDPTPPDPTPAEPTVAPTAETRPRPGPAPVSEASATPPDPNATSPGPPLDARLRVTAEEVELEFGGQTSRGPNRLAREQGALASAATAAARGEALFRALIHDEPAPGVAFPPTRQVWSTLADAHGTVRLALDITGSGGLGDLPWELLGPPGGPPLGTREDRPLWRQLGRRPAPAAQNPKILVFIGSHPLIGVARDWPPNELADLAPVQAELEARVLRAGLDRWAKAGVQVRFLGVEAPATLADLREALEEGYNVVHLLAHGLERRLGLADPADGGYNLIFPRSADDPRTVPVARLLDTLRGRAQLVILAACQSAGSSAGQVLDSLGQALAREVPAVIAMRGNLPMDAAQAFARHFYDDLARSGDVARALAATRMALHQAPALGDAWGLPLLWLSVDQSRLFAGEAPAVAPLAQTPAEDLSDAKRELLQREWERTAQRAAPLLGSQVLQELVLLQKALDAERQQGPRLAQVQDTEAITRGVTRRARPDPRDLKDWLAKQGNKHVFADTVYERLCAALSARQHVVLSGPPGTGKTTLAELVCRYAEDRRYCTGYDLVTATADWTTFDTLGGNVPSPTRGMEYRPGVVVESLRQARWLILDELNRADIDRAIGELFTVLSGQPVTLTYRVDPWPVRLRPSEGKDPDRWLPARRDPFDYIVHPNWRILGTMNVYDRASLYAMSYAFMRRFAFIEVDVPPLDVVLGQLVPLWAEDIASLAGDFGVLQRDLLPLVDEDGPIFQHRRLGPAILKDIVRYVEHRTRAADLPLPGSEEPPPIDPQERVRFAVVEAVELYALPQLDGLRQDAVVAIYQHLQQAYGGAPAAGSLLRRLQEMYPGLEAEDWDRPPGEPRA